MAGIIYDSFVRGKAYGIRNRKLVVWIDIAWDRYSDLKRGKQALLAKKMLGLLRNENQ